MILLNLYLRRTSEEFQISINFVYNTMYALHNFLYYFIHEYLSSLSFCMFSWLIFCLSSILFIEIYLFFYHIYIVLIYLMGIILKNLMGIILKRGGGGGNYAYCAFEIYPFSLRGGGMKNSIQVYLKNISRKLSV